MKKVIILGCGIIGATIAYELSKNKDLEIIVIDHHQPALGATGAALGVLMGIISQKIKGKSWQYRDYSIKRMTQLIPELIQLTGLEINYNTQGIVKLLYPEDSLDKWTNLANIRRQQGWELEIWNLAQLKNKLPQINTHELIGAVYSPQDLQVNPTQLTMALIAGGSKNGVQYHFGVDIRSIEAKNDQSVKILTDRGEFQGDRLILATGLGTTKITTSLNQSLKMIPVLGQAYRVKLPQPLTNANFQPVITGKDVHIVPEGKNNYYWIGATVEFPNNDNEIIPAQELLLEVWNQAVKMLPNLRDGEILNSWSGMRPRPIDRPAPIIEFLPQYPHIILATGHYRNGVLLSPITAKLVEELVNS